MHSFRGTSPLPGNVRASPLQPVEPLEASFHRVSPLGTWTLSLRDQHRSIAVLGNTASLTEGEPAQLLNGTGGVSRWELHFTDVLGSGHSFYMDLAFQVKRLPKYGTLFLTNGTALGPADGEHEQWRGNCAGIDTSGTDGLDSNTPYRHCPESFGVGAPKGQRQRGDLAARKGATLREDATIVYVPNTNYIGPDAFEFQVLQAGNEVESPPASVGLQVRTCRRRGGAFVPPQLKSLCDCASPVLFATPRAQARCLAAIRGACAVRNVSDLDLGNETILPTIVYESDGDGRCDDEVTGVCAPGLPDKVVQDPRPSTASWMRANASVPDVFHRLCLACASEASPDPTDAGFGGARGFRALSPSCWAEWRYALHAFGVRSSHLRPGEDEECHAVADSREESSVQCNEDEGLELFGRVVEPHINNAGRWHGQR